MSEDDALYRKLLDENIATLEGFRASGAAFRKVQEVVFAARFADRAAATATRQELRDRHSFSNDDLVFTKNVPGDETAVDCVIAVNIPIDAEKITYFESLLKEVGANWGGSEYSWEIQP